MLLERRVWACFLQHVKKVRDLSVSPDERNCCWRSENRHQLAQRLVLGAGRGEISPGQQIQPDRPAGIEHVDDHQPSLVLTLVCVRQGSLCLTHYNVRYWIVAAGRRTGHVCQSCVGRLFRL